MGNPLSDMKAAWRESASRNIDELWESIVAMTTDPIEVADLIAEAGQVDPSVAVSVEAMDEINDIAIQAANEG